MGSQMDTSCAPTKTAKVTTLLCLNSEIWLKRPPRNEIQEIYYASITFRIYARDIARRGKDEEEMADMVKSYMCAQSKSNNNNYYYYDIIV